MNIVSKIYNFYLDGFKNMKVGKHLWTLVLIKLFVIMVLLRVFVFDKSLESEYKTDTQRADFVYKNLIK